jgi:hypothetical protein
LEIPGRRSLADKISVLSKDFHVNGDKNILEFPAKRMFLSEDSRVFQ